jgi:hypothetical protein
MEELIVIVSSTWKFAATFPVAIYLFKMTFLETILYTNIGGLIGIIAFTILSRGFLRIIDTMWAGKSQNSKSSKKIFTRRNRRLVLLKNKFGLPGIIVLTPVLLSIPVGVVLITKYFGRKKVNYLYLLTAQFIWSIIYTTVYLKVKTLY